MNPDANVIRQQLEPLWVGGTHELRVLNTPKGTVSGYFDTPTTMAQAAARWSGRAAGVYWTINPTVPALQARANNRLADRVKATTTDRDILARFWIPLDFDPARPAGISSTEEEHELARSYAIRAGQWLKSLGIPREGMILADSGNGYHLLIRVDLPNTPESDALVRQCIDAVALHFSDERVSVDTTCSNAARIWKAYGTVAAKGDDTPERPHRTATIAQDDMNAVLVTPNLLQALTAFAPPPTPATHAERRGAFDIDAFIARHLTVATMGTWQTGRKWVLDICPFDPDHTDGSAVIIEHGSGALSFRCHHNGCTGRTWHDLRERFEPRMPDAPRHRERPPNPESAPAKLRLLTERDREYGLADLLREEFAPLEWPVPQLIPEGLTLIVGKPKLGKSLLTLGVCVAVSLGGRALGVVPVPQMDVLYLALEDGWRRLQTRGRRLLDEAEASNALRLRQQWPRLDQNGLPLLEEYLDARPAMRLVAIDTLQKFRAPQTGRQAFAEDYAALEGLQEMASRRRIAVIVVHHARKGEAEDPLDAINGTSGLAAACDGIILLTRRRSADEATLHVTQRDSEEGDRDLALTFDSTLGSWRLDGDAEEVRTQRASDETLAILRESAEPLRSAEVAELLGIEGATAKMRLARLLKAGDVRMVSRGLYTVAPTAEAVLSLPHYTPYREGDDDEELF